MTTVIVDPKPIQFYHPDFQKKYLEDKLVVATNGVLLHRTAAREIFFDEM